MSNELFIYKLKHQVVHHQSIAEPVFFLCFRKPDPDLKDGVWGLLFLLIKFLVFLGLAVFWEYWTELNRICTVIFIYFFLVVTWYKSGLHLPALWNYLGLKSLTEAMPLGTLSQTWYLSLSYFDTMKKAEKSECGLCWYCFILVI